MIRKLKILSRRRELAHENRQGTETGRRKRENGQKRARVAAAKTAGPWSYLRVRGTCL